jgi:3-methyladenine DNA glycosylase/8-oxoguanine DNA glycosylase
VSLRRSISLATPIDVDAVLSVFVRGPFNPTMVRERPGTWWRATRTPDGPATLHIVAKGGSIEFEAWGEGSSWAIEYAPDLVGANDSLEGFVPTGIVAEIATQHPGLRIPRSRAVFQGLILAILEQKVTGKEARDGYHALLRTLAEPAPGPYALSLPPTPKAVVGLPSFDFRALGIEGKRANVIVEVARRANRLEALIELPPSEARSKLEMLPGIGPWTSAELARTALGDADAVSVGDYHLPRLVTLNLGGEAVHDDARMLELLAPYAGHRGRVCQLLMVGGKTVPRRGPRMSVSPFAAMSKRRIQGWARKR